jgi:hypothetical protein
VRSVLCGKKLFGKKVSHKPQFKTTADYADRTDKTGYRKNISQSDSPGR